MYSFDTTKHTIQSILDRKSSKPFVVSDIDLDVPNLIGLSLYNGISFKETQDSTYEQTFNKIGVKYCVYCFTPILNNKNKISNKSCWGSD